MNDLIRKLKEIENEMEKILDDVPKEFIKTTKNKANSKRLNEMVDRYSLLWEEKKEIEKKLSYSKRKK
jgi:hypothetical protein